MGKVEETIEYIIFLVAFLGSAFILSNGIEPLLFFIPSSWGSYDDEGIFMNAKDYISGVFGISATLFLIYIYGRLKKSRDELSRKNAELEIELEVQRRKEYLRTLPRSSRHEKYEEYKEKLAKLDNNLDNLTDEERQECRVLLGVTKDIDID
jgi:hypothetical protein